MHLRFCKLCVLQLANELTKERTVFFRTALPCTGGYHLERGGMPLHDAVGIKCKKCTTTQGAGFKYMGSGVYVV